MVTETHAKHIQKHRQDQTPSASLSIIVGSSHRRRWYPYKTQETTVLGRGQKKILYQVQLSMFLSLWCVCIMHVCMYMYLHNNNVYDNVRTNKPRRLSHSVKSSKKGRYLMSGEEGRRVQKVSGNSFSLSHSPYNAYKTATPPAKRPVMLSGADRFKHRSAKQTVVMVPTVRTTPSAKISKNAPNAGDGMMILL